MIKKNLELWERKDSHPFIELKNISKSFDGHSFIENINLSIYKNEFFSFLGASGSGKTTLLRLIAGLEEPDEGKIYIDGVDVTHLAPYERCVNMMFQSYALFPHMNVRENIAFALYEDKLEEKIVNSRVESTLKLVGMLDKIERGVENLSGGEKQRLALARCLAKRPKVLLLDEPLTALDKTLREQTQLELCNIQEEVGITFIMVTHDQEEAMTMSSRIAIFSDKKIIQVGTPGEIYEYPNSLASSRALGSINIFKGIIVESNDNGFTLVCSDELNCLLKVAQTSVSYIGAEVNVAIRPEKMILTGTKPESGVNCLEGIVDDILYLGDMSIYYIMLSSKRVVITSQTNIFRFAERPITWEDKVYVYWQPNNSLILLQ